MVSTFGCTALAVLKINFQKISILKVQNLLRWLKNGMFKYRGAIINTTLLLLYCNIDRLIVTKIGSDLFVNQYAVATSIFLNGIFNWLIEVL